MCIPWLFESSSAPFQPSPGTRTSTAHPVHPAAAIFHTQTPLLPRQRLLNLPSTAFLTSSHRTHPACALHGSWTPRCPSRGSMSYRVPPSPLTRTPAAPQTTKHPLPGPKLPRMLHPCQFLHPTAFDPTTYLLSLRLTAPRTPQTAGCCFRTCSAGPPEVQSWLY